MDERYPIGETDSVAVAVLRHDRATRATSEWSVAIGLRSGEATVHVPGHYPGVLAGRLRAADAQFAPGARLGRDEYLDLTALAREDEETLALSSTARVAGARHRRGAARGARAALAPARRSAAADRGAAPGLGLVPDSVPDASSVGSVQR